MNTQPTNPRYLSKPGKVLNHACRLSDNGWPTSSRLSHHIYNHHDWTLLPRVPTLWLMAFFFLPSPNNIPNLYRGGGGSFLWMFSKTRVRQHNYSKTMARVSKPFLSASWCFCGPNAAIHAVWRNRREVSEVLLKNCTLFAFIHFY